MALLADLPVFIIPRCRAWNLMILCLDLCHGTVGTSEEDCKNTEVWAGGFSLKMSLCIFNIMIYIWDIECILYIKINVNFNLTYIIVQGSISVYVFQHYLVFSLPRVIEEGILRFFLVSHLHARIGCGVNGHSVHTKKIQCVWLQSLNWFIKGEKYE